MLQFSVKASQPDGSRNILRWNEISNATRNKFLWTGCIKISAYKLCLAKVDSLGACGLGLIDCFSIIKTTSDFQVIWYFALAGVTCLSTKVFFSPIQYVSRNQQDIKSVSNLLKTIRYLWQSQSKLYIVSRRKFSQKSYAVIDINQIMLRSQCFQMAMPCWVFSISLIIPQPKDIFSPSPNEAP